MNVLDTMVERIELLKWISERNAHVPMADLEFLIGITPFGGDADHQGATSYCMYQDTGCHS
ncbi:MAG: hypothetical protein R8K50_04615 [Mariprofundus sp.]